MTSIKSTKSRIIGYWLTTAIVAFVMLFGGVANLLHFQPTVDGVVRLGYPTYILTLLGFWKVLGGIAVLAPRLPRLKEWAYAGIFFELTGAVASHVAHGDRFGEFVWPAVFALLTLASWALRPPGRVLAA